MKSYTELPRDYKFSGEREWEKKRIITEAMLKLKIHSYSTMFQSFASFEDFKVNKRNKTLFTVDPRYLKL